MAGNQQLARRARDIAARAGRTTERKAALCCSVALGTTTNAGAARAALDQVTHEGVRLAAIKLLDQLTTEQETAP